MNKATLRLDRVIPDVGRIARFTGTHKKSVRDAMNRMLDSLRSDGRLDVLRALRDGDLSPMRVYEAYQRRSLESLAIGVTALPMGDSFKEWIARHDCSEQHRSSLETSRRYLVGQSPSALVADLPDVLDRLRLTLGSAHPRSFNIARSAAQAFVRSTCKRSHPLWLRVAAVEPMKVRPQRRGKPLALTAMRSLFPSPTSDPVDAIAWSMATTGMGPKEYWGRWNVATDRVHIDGTKRDGRVRDVPLLIAPTPPRFEHPRTFSDKLRARTREITVYDLRRTYAHWLEEAHIPRTRRRMYLGHGQRDVTDLYERHEVEAYLVDDAARLRLYVGCDVPSRLTLSKAIGA